MLSKQRWELTTVTALRAVYESLWLALLVGLLTLLAYATKIIGSDLTLQGQNNAIKNMAKKPGALHDMSSNTHSFFPFYPHSFSRFIQVNHDMFKMPGN